MKIYLAFGVNVLFSLFCAYYALFETDYLINMYFSIHPWIIKGLGVGLAWFALDTLIELIKGPNIKNCMHITFADIAWILLSSVIAFLYYDVFGEKGFNLILLINLDVAIIAALQYMSLFSLIKHADTQSEFDTFIEIECKIHSSREQFWSVLSNLPDIYKYASNVASSRIIASDTGVGAKRLCSDGKSATWTEEIYEWKDGESVSMSFDPNVEGFPFPATKLNGGWIIDGHSNKVKVWFELNGKNRMTKALMPLLGYIWNISLTPAIKKMDEAALCSEKSFSYLP